MDLASKPAPTSPPFFTEENKVWVSKEHLPLEDGHVVRMGEKKLEGFVAPTCDKFKNPTFSDESVYAKMQGTVALLVQVLPDGFPAKITLVRGLPCGLTDRSFEAVEHWKFKPARGPDGQPVAAQTELEVTFTLY
jgi:TonB family protein